MSALLEGGLSTPTNSRARCPQVWEVPPPHETPCCTDWLHLASQSAPKLRRAKQSRASAGLWRCISGSSRSCATALRFAERICWLLVFIFLKCVLFTGNFSLIAFCCFPRLQLRQHMMYKCLVVPASQRDLGGGCRSFELYGAHAAVRTIPAVNLGNIRAFWSSNGKHLPKSISGTSIETFWALISNGKWFKLKAVHAKQNWSISPRERACNLSTPVQEGRVLFFLGRCCGIY